MSTRRSEFCSKIAHACGVVGLALFSALALAEPARSAGDAHGYPRTYHVYGGWTQAETLAKYDMVVGYASYDVGFLRSRNPNGIFLLQPGLTPTNAADYAGVSVTYGAVDDWKGGCDDLSGGLNLGCIRAFDPYWDYLHNANGTIAGRDGGTSNHAGWNLADPKDKGTAEMVAKVFAYAGKKSGLYTKGWDGLHSDNWAYTIGEGWFYGPNLDTDRDGQVDDYSVLRWNWSNGLAGASHTLRTHLPGKVIGGNGVWYKNPGAYGGSETNGWLNSANYTLIEYWDQFYGNPDKAIAEAREWLDHPDPYGQPRYVAGMARALNADGSRFCIPSDASPNQDVYMLNSGVMKSMRWGLTLALMADVYYEIYVGCPTRHHTRWWYDEFDGGDGVRRRGYLGRPLEAPFKLANGVYRRNFENGIALNNSTSSSQTIPLGATFKKLKGTQNPSLNDGSLVSSVTVPAKDGVILLRSGGSVVTSSPPLSTSPPAVGGTAQEGSTLSASTGSWSGSTPMTFAYKWKRCNTSGSDCAAISGATARAYEAATADVGHTLRVTVLASNTAGSDSATSSPTGLIQPLDGSLPDPGPIPSDTEFRVFSVTPVTGETVKGLAYWRAKVAGDTAVRVEFLIDGQLRWTERVSPYEFNSGEGTRWDTSAEAPGAHTLTNRAYTANGREATSTITVVVAREVPVVREFEAITDEACASCAVGVADGRLQATIEGGSDDLDTAYGRYEFGGTSGWNGRVYARDVVRLPAGQAITEKLVLFQVRDVNDTLVYELTVEADRIVRLVSPPGGLSANGIEANTGVVLPADGTPRRVEVAAQKNGSVAVRVDGLEVLRLADLSGATTGNQHLLRAGIVRYDGASTGETVVARHGGVGVGTGAWLDRRGLVGPVRLVRRPGAMAGRRLVLRVRTVPGSQIRAVVRGPGGRKLGVGRARADESGRARFRVWMRRWQGQRRISVIVTARQRIDWEVTTARTRRVVRLRGWERSRLWSN